MSRTYRKNPRHFRKFRGEIYTTYRDKSIHGKASMYAKNDWKYDDPFWGSNYFYQEVLVGDCDNCADGPSSDMKKIYHRIDRARYKVALLRNEDAHILSSCDPWLWGD